MSNIFDTTGGGNTPNNAFSMPSSNNTPTTSSGLFGSNTVTTSAGAFGQTSTATGSKPGFSFGSLSTTSGAGLFGGGTNGTAGGPAKPLFGNTAGSTSGPGTPALGASTGNASTQQFSFAKLGAPASSTPASGGLFSNTKTSAPTSSSPFGNVAASAPPAGGLFGGSAIGAPTSAPPSSGLFGNATLGPPSSGSLFGNAAAKAPAFGGSFGIGTPAGSNMVKATFGVTSTPGDKDKEDKPAAPTQSGGLFASSANNNASDSAQAGTSTPAPLKTVNNFASTTPAGPPPTANAQPSASTGGMFAHLNNNTEKPAAPSGGGLFGSNAGTASNPLGARPASGGGLLGSSNQSTSASSAPNETPSNTQATSAPGTETSSTSAPAAPSAPAPTSGLFGSSSTTKDTSTPSTTAPSSTAPAATSGLFGGASASASNAQPASSTATTGASSAPNAQSTTQTTAGASTGPQLGASTAGPPPQHSRLKNKTMDEIITRWASDLSKYQKEFQEQAAKVAAWDRLLVENGAKIQTLYNSTFEAERTSAEVERQLVQVESHQDELAGWLDRYEAEVDEVHSRPVGPGDMLQGPDQERERTYKLAEKLENRLDEMGKDLGKMIIGINESSATLNKSSRVDDPLTNIVRVLNSHLTQLQWIDQNSKALQDKIETAKRLGQSIESNWYGGPEIDASESFYRSFMGRR